MKRRPTNLYIGGEWTGGASEFETVNPATGEVIASVADADRSLANRAIEAARDSQRSWAGTSHVSRSKLMHDIASLIDANRDQFIEILVAESGSWIGKASFETDYVASVFRTAAAAPYQMIGSLLPSEHGKLSMITREPVGVVVAISPWNFPLLLSARSIATAIAVGNSVVLKPSEETPISGGLMLAAVCEAAGLPPGVLNVVTTSRSRVAEVGDELVSNPNVGSISFTGSTAVGKQIGSKAGGLLKKVSLELGGKDAIIVLDDADMDRAVSAAAFSSFMHAGQICMSAEKVIVHEAAIDRFLPRFIERTSALTVGNPNTNPIGPIINEKQMNHIRSLVDDAVESGAEILAGGRSRGLCFEPTILAGVTPQMRVYSEETFGPVVPIMVVADDDEAVRVANDTPYGLSSGIISQDEARALRIAAQLDTGMVHINDGPVNDEPHATFGGVKDSGLGRMGGAAAIESSTITRWITVDRGGRHYPPAFSQGS